MKTGDELRQALKDLQSDNWISKNIGEAPWRIEALGREWCAADERVDLRARR